MDLMRIIILIIFDSEDISVSELFAINKVVKKNMDDVTAETRQLLEEIRSRRIAGENDKVLSRSRRIRKAYSQLSKLLVMVSK